MTKRKSDFTLTTLDDLFTTQEMRDEAKLEKVQNIPLEDLQPFENHPFKVADDEEMKQMIESIERVGTISPALARPLDNGKYELISGHRRMAACKALGLETMPVIVRDMTDDEAVITMADANLQRETILPSEKAFAYKMKLEALKHQGRTYGQVVHKSRDNISDTESGRNIQRYIRLTYLIPELLKLVDEDKIAFTPAVEISYLSEYEQRTLLDQIEFTDATPSLSQAQRLRKFSEQGRCSTDVVFAVLCEEKANQKEQLRFMEEDIRKYFPRSYTKADMQKTIILLLEKWQRQRERNRRDER